MTTINFSEIKQEKKNLLIQRGIEVFDDVSSDASDSKLVAKHGRLYSITIELKLMSDGSIIYVLRPTAVFLEAFKQYMHTEETTLNIFDKIDSVARHIKSIHNKYDELHSNERSCANCKYADLSAREEPCIRCYSTSYFKPKETNKKEAKTTNMEHKIKKVIFNDPATIVFWKDGTKTVVKCGKNDTYDKEKGLALCIAKKVYGNKYRWYDIFKKYIPELKEEKKDEK